MRDDLELNLCEVCEEMKIEYTCDFCGNETCENCISQDENGNYVCWMCSE